MTPADGALRVTFDLSPRDIRYFRSRLRRVAGSGLELEEKTILRKGALLIEEAAGADPPEFVTTRLAKLSQLIEMLQDDQWRLVGRDRTRILNALAYFVDPDDMIPDRVPGIGYLDDAIMVELVVQELKHEIKAYEDFCAFREKGSPEGSLARLEQRRRALQARMRGRRRRDREERKARSPKRTATLNLW